jgi:pilus assembly protein CpaB
MRQRPLLTLGLAAVLAGASVLMVRVWLAQHTTVAEAAAPQATLVVARTQLAFGTKLTPELLKTVEWPADSVPKGAFTSVDTLLGGDKQRVVLRTLEPNELILEGKITGPDGRGTLSMTIEEGKRAYTIRVDDIHGVGGFVLPADRVDILLTRDAQQSDQRQRVADLLLQNVKVLAIDQEASDRVEGAKLARSVTLEVTPEQAQKLTLASSIGTLSLTLRNHAATDATRPRTITIQDLTRGDETRPSQGPQVAAVPPRDPTIRIVRGTDSTEVPVRRDGGARWN